MTVYYVSLRCANVRCVNVRSDTSMNLEVSFFCEFYVRVTNPDFENKLQEHRVSVTLK